MNTLATISTRQVARILTIIPQCPPPLSTFYHSCDTFIVYPPRPYVLASITVSDALFCVLVVLMDPFIVLEKYIPGPGQAPANAPRGWATISAKGFKTKRYEQLSAPTTVGTISTLMLGTWLETIQQTLRIVGITEHQFTPLCDVIPARDLLVFERQVLLSEPGDTKIIAWGATEPDGTTSDHKMLVMMVGSWNVGVGHLNQMHVILDQVCYLWNVSFARSL